MTMAPTTMAERVMSLPVGKSCVVSTRNILRTVRKHLPGARFIGRCVDGHFVITRVA